MKVFVFLLACFLYVEGAPPTLAPTQMVDSRCIRKDVTNGCSNPLAKFDPISQFINKLFFDDCNRHDICYQCGHTLGINRTECDSIFLQNMKNTCNPLKKKRFLGVFPQIGEYVGNVLGAATDIAGNVLIKPVESIANAISSGQVLKDPLGAGANVLLSPVHSAETLSCGMAAEIYYTAVRTAGNSHFDQKSHIECSEAWVNPCLPSPSHVV